MPEPNRRLVQTLSYLCARRLKGSHMPLRLDRIESIALRIPLLLCWGRALAEGTELHSVSHW